MIAEVIVVTRESR